MNLWDFALSCKNPKIHFIYFWPSTMQENAKPQGEEKNFDIQIPPSQEPKVVETL